ncbi:MAG: lipid A phosphoethanolamine transferase, partial [Alistipes sp.]|nr:lipid A phosphoethanolamine transferase [Alistipes sp.]
MTITSKYSATKLSVAFVVALMLPVIALAYTEQNPFWVTLSSILLPLGGYSLWAALSARSGRMVWAAGVFVFLSAFQIVLLYLFGDSVIATDMFLNLITTNAGEASELLSNLFPSVIFVCLVYIPLLWKASVHLAHKVELSDRARRGFATTGFIALVAGVATLNIGERGGAREILRDEVFPINACYNFGLSISEAIKINNFERTSKDFVYNVSRERVVPQREIYVLVIGEASRAANWQLYGYERRTNPKLMARDDIFPFRAMTTLSNTTHKSVPMMLSSVAATEHDMIYRRKGLLAMFNEAGFETYFISNQSPQGAMIDYLAADAENVIYLDAGQYDAAMIKAMESAIKDNPAQKMLFVLHTYGSHYSYRHRYPREFARYTPDDDVAISKKNVEQMRNAYDNSILYTDYFLNEVIDVLGSQQDACCAMFYCSDHGEDLMDNGNGNFLHSSPKTTYYQTHVASLAWFSPLYRNLFADK